MFAIVATSGKQFRVTEGDRIIVDRVAANVGQTVRLDSVLMVGGDDKPLVGTPFVDGAAVEATVVSHRAGDKVIVFKFEARKRKRRKTGHRQLLSELRIGAIRAPGDHRHNPPPTNASNARIAPERGSRGPAGPPSSARGEGDSPSRAARARKTKSETTTEE